MKEKPYILIVDDDVNISRLVELYLEKEGYQVKTAARGDDAVEEFTRLPPDLMVLEVMLPGLDGYQVLKSVRKKSSIPVIMLTARDETFDKVLGLELGADDYIVKPFDTKELVARIKAVLRRFQQPDSQDDQELSFPGLTVNLSQYTVSCMGKELEMPPKELELLYFLASSPNRVFTREQLLDQLWGYYDYVGDTRTVDVHIKRLREKIGDHEKWRIATIWGIGYKFEVNP